MKRSEMLNKIRESLMDKSNHEIDETALFLLNLIEQAGMLPPTTYLDNIWVQDNAWEPEDE